MVKMRKEGERKRRSNKMSETETPLLTIISIILRILSIRRTMVMIIDPIRKIGRISFKM
jgi:hypothetical protein